MKSQIYRLIVFVGFVFVPVLCNNLDLEQKQHLKRSALYHHNGLTNLIKLGSVRNYNNDRQKRSPQDFLGQVQEMGMNVAGIAKEMANEGFAVKESRSKSINFFGQKIGGSYDVKAGMGDSLNDPSTDDDDDKKRKKRAPIPCRKSDSETDADEEDADDNERKRRGKNKNNNRSKKKDNNRRKRQVQLDNDNNSKSMDNKEIDEKIGVVKKITEAMTEMWQNIANTFQKIGQKFSSSNEINPK